MEERALLSTLYVSSTADSGPGSLRQAIEQSVPGDLIKFAPTLDGQTIALVSGPLRVRHNLMIQGLGADHTVISGGNSSRVFNVFGQGVDLTLADLSIVEGKAAPQSPAELAREGRRTIPDAIADARAYGLGGLANALTRADAARDTLDQPQLATVTIEAHPSRSSLPSDPLERAEAFGLGGVVNALKRARASTESRATPVDSPDDFLGNGRDLAQAVTQASAGKSSTTVEPATSGESGDRTPTVRTTGSTTPVPALVAPEVRSGGNALGRAFDHGIQALANAQARAHATPRLQLASVASVRPDLHAAQLARIHNQALKTVTSREHLRPGSALGGAVYVSAGGNLTIVNSVLAHNQAIASGGGDAGQGGRGGDAIGGGIYALGSHLGASGNAFRSSKVFAGDGGSGGGGGSGSVSPVLSNSSVNLANLITVSPRQALVPTNASPQVIVRNSGRDGGGPGGSGGDGGNALGGSVFTIGHRVTLVGNTFNNSRAVAGDGGNGGGGGNGAVNVTVSGRSSVTRYNTHGLRTGGGRGGNGGQGGDAFGGAVFNVGSRAVVAGNVFVDTEAVAGNGGNGGGGGGGAVGVYVADTDVSIGGLGGAGGLGLGGGIFNA